MSEVPVAEVPSAEAPSTAERRRRPTARHHRLIAMAALAPAVAAVRAAVRRGLADAVARLTRCWSPAPAAPTRSRSPCAARVRHPALRTHCGLVTVDHGLQAGSADRAARARRLGAGPRVRPGGRAAGQGRRPRRARRRRPGTPGTRRCVAAAKAHRAVAVLLGHTRDDQAETVLLALARGAGPHGLAGMPARRERQGVLFARPLLDVTRADTRAACEVAG